MEKTPLEYKLALWLMPNLTISIQQSILRTYPNLYEFFELSSTALKNLGFKTSFIEALQTPNWKTVEKIIDWVAKPNHHLIFLHSSNYPKILQEIHNPPCVLMAQGQLSLLDHSQLAIIGSRNPTVSGLEIAKNYAQLLSQQGLVITSGLALGIDAAAHKGSLTQTIAVLGTGIDINYPKSNARLSDEIREKGLLITEFHLGTPPKACNFPRRNRIISGLTLGTFVVEATLKSGSLVTARFALEQGREVFAMPGSIHNPMAKGCHFLLKQGANLVESVDDIWEHIRNQPLRLYKNASIFPAPLDIAHKNPHLINLRKNLSKFQQQLLDAVGFDTIGIDLLTQKMTMNIEQLSVELLELEILGLIEAVPGGFQRI